jgi:hypothetical protein
MQARGPTPKIVQHLLHFTLQSPERHALLGQAKEWHIHESTLLEQYLGQQQVCQAAAVQRTRPSLESKMIAPFQLHRMGGWRQIHSQSLAASFCCLCWQQATAQAGVQCCGTVLYVCMKGICWALA